MHLHSHMSWHCYTIIYYISMKGMCHTGIILCRRDAFCTSDSFSIVGDWLLEADVDFLIHPPTPSTHGTCQKSIIEWSKKTWIAHSFKKQYYNVLFFPTFFLATMGPIYASDWGTEALIIRSCLFHCLMQMTKWLIKAIKFGSALTNLLPSTISY